MRQKRISDYGYRIGHRESGPRNKITDVPGVRVGHATVEDGNQHTGVTVIVPGEGNPFLKKYLASAYVHNGFGKTCGLVQIQELGTLETPIALTNTLNVGKVADAMISWMIQQTKKEGEDVFSINPVVGECNDSRINEIGNRAVGEKELYQALEQADTDFAEGAVGAGTGTICYGLKGGIGSSSRTLVLDGKTYTIRELASQEMKNSAGATWDAATAGNAIGTWSASFGDQIDVIASNNDGMGMSMFNAWAKDNKVPTFGYDANSDAVAAIAEGYGGTISQHADVQAYLTLRVLRNALDGVDINTGIGTADEAGNCLTEGEDYRYSEEDRGISY